MKKKILDLTGEVCPVPLWRTQEAVTVLLSGELLQVETDFTRAVRNITQWCSREGHTYDLIEPGPGLWRIVITKQ